MATIFHIALAEDWAAAQEAGAYTVSTRGRTLAEQGFIHCSRGDQWPRVRDAIYADVYEPLLLLQIETDRLDVPVVEEPGAPGTSETFPHVYGPLPLDAVVRTLPVTAPGRPTATQPPPGSFTRTFFTEMFVNMGLVLLVMVTTSIGLGVGSLVGEEVAPVVGAGVGLLVGVVAARRIFLRRHASNQ